MMTPAIRRARPLAHRNSELDDEFVWNRSFGRPFGRDRTFMRTLAMQKKQGRRNEYRKI